MVYFRIILVIVCTIIALTMIGVGAYFTVQVSSHLRTDTTSMGYLFIVFGAMYGYFVAQMIKKFSIDF